MNANFKFWAYEGQEGDEQIGLYYAPTSQTDDEIGPHRPGTGMVLFEMPDKIRFTSVYGEKPVFMPRDIKAMLMVAQPIMEAEFV